jgi:hypothetical protein
VDRGITTPIGIADTAIGRQRIEEFMNNESYTAIGRQRIEEFMNNESYTGATHCPDEEGVTAVRCLGVFLTGISTRGCHCPDEEGGAEVRCGFLFLGG